MRAPRPSAHDAPLKKTPIATFMRANVEAPEPDRIVEREHVVGELTDADVASAATARALAAPDPHPRSPSA